MASKPITPAQSMRLCGTHYEQAQNKQLCKRDTHKSSADYNKTLCFTFPPPPPCPTPSETYHASVLALLDASHCCANVHAHDRVHSHAAS